VTVPAHAPVVVVGRAAQRPASDHRAMLHQAAAAQRQPVDRGGYPGLVQASPTTKRPWACREPRIVLAVSVATIRDGVRSPGANGALARARASLCLGVVVGLTLLAAALRFTRIGHQGFWYDEAATNQLVHLSLSKMLAVLPQTQATPPLYFALAWVWARVFGFGEAGLRSLSALAGVATVPVVYGLGRELISPRAGIVAAALTACSPMLVWYSQEARSYSLLVLLSAVSLLMFARVLSEPQLGRVIGWAAASALALATHYFAIVVVAPSAAWLVWMYRRQARVLLGVAAVGLAGLALIPLALSERQHGRWVAFIPFSVRLGQIRPQFVVGTGATAGGGLMRSLATGVLLAALVLMVARGDARERRAAMLAGAIAAAGFALALILLRDDVITRNVIALWVPCALLIAAGLGARRAGLFGLAGAAVLCAIGLIAIVEVTITPNLQRPDWRPVARALGPPPRHVDGDGGRAILVQHYRTLLPLGVYQPRLRLLGRSGAPVTEIDIIGIDAPYSASCWWGAACGLTASQLQSTYPIPGFRAVSRERVSRFSILRLRADRPHRLTPRMVAGALTTTTLPRDVLIIQSPA
jgi:mannosyltransferase